MTKTNIEPFAIWPDDRGEHIQAHGGGVIQLGDTWYWFGEDRTRDMPAEVRGVACYSSKDLVNWEYRNRVFSVTAEELGLERLVVERPKCFFNQKSGKYVLYMHIDDEPGPDQPRGYQVAEVGIAVCDTIDGDYQFVRRFRPLGQESRDIGQFIDDDGSAYLIFESRPTGGFFIASLTEDYMDVAEEVAFIKAGIEGGAIVRYEGLYYLIGSQMTAWDPNPNKYTTAKSLSGPWSELRDIAPPETNTYLSQSTNLVKVTGTHKTTVLYLGDQWRPETQWDSRYLWMPLEIGNGHLELPKPCPWSIDVQTGEVSM